jgi:hypothetical protein
MRCGATYRLITANAWEDRVLSLNSWRFFAVQWVSGASPVSQRNLRACRKAVEFDFAVLLFENRMPRQSTVLPQKRLPEIEALGPAKARPPENEKSSIGQSDRTICEKLLWGHPPLAGHRLTAM